MSVDNGLVVNSMFSFPEPACRKQGTKDLNFNLRFAILDPSLSLRMKKERAYKDLYLRFNFEQLTQTSLNVQSMMV
tara:strand:- start:115115 stop:115342 length:228 start_codon:yes stop_codon:yes gene_type:complete